MYQPNTPARAIAVAVLMLCGVLFMNALTAPGQSTATAQVAQPTPTLQGAEPVVVYAISTVVIVATPTPDGEPPPAADVAPTATLAPAPTEAPPPPVMVQALPPAPEPVYIYVSAPATMAPPPAPTTQPDPATWQSHGPGNSDRGRAAVMAGRLRQQQQGQQP